MKSLNFAFKSSLFALLLVFLSFDVTAQDNTDRPLPQFMFPTFTEGYIVMKEGENFSALLNYNMVDQIMVTELNGVYRYATKMQDIDTIYLEYKKFVPVDKVFYEVLVKGLAAFFLQNKSLYTPKGSNVGYGMKSQSVGPTDFKRYELVNVCYQYNEVVHIELPPNVDVTPAFVYWVRISDEMKKFTNERQFFKIFPEKESELKEYIKKEKINLKVREDIIKLGTYCNELLK
ncbi:MAG: hypothetical protein Q7T72_10105 [Bacteroidales bacterium]|nr:hypothetical protein [Bacteroidales bacterium]MDP3003222.1 hypothetical protein [Bacteroidales bacterium]